MRMFRLTYNSNNNLLEDLEKARMFQLPDGSNDKLFKDLVESGMFQQPDCSNESLSLKLSELLNDIGVSTEMVMKRRRTWLLNQSIHQTVFFKLCNDNVTVYYLGSQSEGTTVLGLMSDVDRLECQNDINVIQDLSEWKPNKINYLMVQDETVSNGYCLLQLTHDIPSTLGDVTHEYVSRDNTGRLLLKNTIIQSMACTSAKTVIHGPAETYPGYHSTDRVIAFPCKSWPRQASQWLLSHDSSRWPSGALRKQCISTGCFVVGVGRSGSDKEALEWRISTSLAERCLMLQLNITQIRCYVLMKIIVKSFISPYFEDAISSYMCKTIIFHCIANESHNVWRENNLLDCLRICLDALYFSVLNENCPHFFIPDNNLIVGHITDENKYKILRILKRIIKNNVKELVKINCHGLGSRFFFKIVQNISDSPFFQEKTLEAGKLLRTLTHEISSWKKIFLFFLSKCNYKQALQMLLNNILKLIVFSNQYKGLDQVACQLLLPWLYAHLWSVLASSHIQRKTSPSKTVHSWISSSMNTDVTSTALRQASALLCYGNIEQSEQILREAECNYNPDIVEPFCQCYEQTTRELVVRQFEKIAESLHEKAIQRCVAFCFEFLPCEIYCVPIELKYEMFRCTKPELAVRDEYVYFWMDWAVVDALPYLYFLQYKTYGYMGKEDKKQTALSNLIGVSIHEPDLGHRETAFNLLGQCMEMEERVTDALNCYLLSLKVRRINNAANIHICKLLSKIVSSKYVGK